METVGHTVIGGNTALPTGMVSFLFTDIEGSTVRWERDPIAMQAALRRHDEILRAAIVGTGGVVFKTVGDAFYAVFQSPDAAVDGALVAQRELARRQDEFAEVGGMRVRMALHAGIADERDGDYFGQALNRVARLLGIGHGGQVLLSATIVRLAEGQLPAELSLADLGEHRLKDLTAPEHVFQLLASGLDHEFPRLRSLSVLDNNLPQQLTSLVGRHDDVAAIKESLRTSSLVTLIGAGGVGKTRAALQVGAEVLEAFPDGVWFVDFAPITDASLAAIAIGAVFDLQESGSRPMLDVLTAHLKSKNTLLIFDNCEHLIAEISRLSAGLVRGCHGVKILATSREHLGVNGETLYRLPSLGVPDDASHITADVAREFGAVDLFAVRARGANPRFAITDENAGVVSEICRRLDGIPLAIELAAARVKVLTPRQISEKLNERFRLLAGGDRTALPRQQTMRAAIDWSYDSLTGDEQHVFCMLSIFVGTFALETAVAVCGEGNFDVFDLMALISSLVDKSLLNAEFGDVVVRYRLLESTRQYAAEKLLERGEREIVAARHAEAYAAVCDSIVDEYDTVAHDVWTARVEAELENVRAALTWAFDDADPTFGMRIAATLHRTMALVSAREAQRWLTTAVDRCRDDACDPGLLGRLELALAFLSNVFNQWAVMFAHANKAIDALDAPEHARAKADAQRLAGRSLIYLGHHVEGEELLETALGAHRLLGSRGTGAVLRDLALARAAAGDIDRARDLFSQAIRDFQRREDLGNVAQTVGTLAGIEFQAGNIDAALIHGAQALEALRKLKRRISVAWILGEMATFSIAIAALDEAYAFAREALAIARELPSALHVAYSLHQLVIVAALRPYAYAAEQHDCFERNAQVLGFVEARLVQLGTTQGAAEQRHVDMAREMLRAYLGTDTLARYEREGADLTEDQALALALRPVQTPTAAQP